MHDDSQDSLGSLIRQDVALEFDAEFALRMEEHLRTAQRRRNMIAISVVAGLVLACGAALSLSFIFLGVAKGQIANGPAWDITQVVFWLPYATVSLTLAIFVRELILHAVIRRFGSPM